MTPGPLLRFNEPLNFHDEETSIHFYDTLSATREPPLREGSDRSCPH